MQDDEASDDADGGVADDLNLSERTPADIEQQILALSVSSTVDELCAGICAADWLLSRAKGIHRLKNEIGIAWIDHNGEFDFGNIHYSVGYSSVYKCLDIPQTGHAVLTAAGGDFDQFLTVLVAQPFKQSSVRSMISRSLYGQLFDCRRVGRLVNGVPDRVLKHQDKRFISDRQR